MSVELTDQQLRFVEAYEGNIQSAAQAAGLSYDYARRLITKGHIARAIKERQAERIRPNILTREQRQEWWSKVVQDQAEDMKNRLKASELLGKSEADFTDKIQHAGAVGIIVEVSIDDGNE